MYRIKTILSLLLLTVGAMTAYAQASYDNVAGTISWAVGNETRGAATTEISDAVLETSVSVGTDLNITSTSATYKLSAESTVGPYVTYQPQTGNPGCVAGDMIEYKVKLKKGLTFTPSSVAFDAVKEGTDNAYFSWSYTIDGVESGIVAYNDPKTQIRRNNDVNPSAPLTHNEAITAAEGGRVFTLRLYISNVANDKKMSIGNIKINGTVSGTEEVRAFQNFKINFRTDPYTVLEPAAGLPQGVTVNGTFHDGQHGYNTTTITVPVDGPVKFTIGSCQYGNHTAVIKKADGTELASVDTNGDCDTNTSFDHSTVWTYNSEEPAELVITTPQYIPFFYAEACELLPMVNVEYYDTDEKLLGAETVQGGSQLVYKYGENDVTVAEGLKFRGWFASTQTTALKVAEGTIVQDNLKLYARATAIEVAEVGKIFTYPLNSQSFYIEDHECITSTGQYHDGQHGYSFGTNQNVAVKVAGNAVLVLGLCKYGNEGTLVLTDAQGNQVGESVTLPVANDGSTASFTYEGPATTLTATFTNGGYLHNVTVYNVESIPTKNEAGYYELAPNDGASLQLVLAAIKSGDKIYLPNGVYDFGEKALTTISAANVSIIGESMKGTIIRNAPAKETEGIGTTATLLNTSSNLYLQDLTIQNALDYYATGSAGRAVCLQDKGNNTICKNVRMLSYQDTYYSNAASKFYWEDSEIHGTVDYLCGDGDVVYNRCKFVNESRAKGSKSGSDVVAAPYTSAQCTWGYVFLDCEISSECNDFTFARSWGGNSAAQYIRTKVTDNSLNASRWTIAGMNVAAYKFREFGTMDKDGNITTPESNYITFTHASGNNPQETVLSAEVAAQYTVANIYGTWAPDVTCRQVTNLDGGTIYLAGGKITTVLPTSGKVRVANNRGGFGPEIDVQASAIRNIVSESAAKPVKVITADGVKIVNGKKTFNVAGQEL